MANILGMLRTRFRPAIVDLVEPLSDPALIEWSLNLIRYKGQPFADYQVDCCMGLAKKLKLSGRVVATRIIDAVDVDDFCYPLKITGPGFINIRIRDEWLADTLTELARECPV